MFPVRFTDSAPRRLFVGLVPTSSADTFRAAGALSPLIADIGPNGEKIDPRMAEFDTRVIGPLEALRDATLAPADGLSDEARSAPSRVPKASAEEVSRFLLLDLAELLATHLPVVWTAVKSHVAPPGSEPELAAVYTLLDTRRAAAASSPTVRAALVEAWDQRLRIQAEEDAGLEHRPGPPGGHARCREPAERHRGGAPQDQGPRRRGGRRTRPGPHRPRPGGRPQARSGGAVRDPLRLPSPELLALWRSIS